MQINEDVLGRCAIIDWNQYKKSFLNYFVLDEQIEIDLLEKALCEINKVDKDIIIYASTYPIEKKESGIRMYSDMLWIKTALTSNQLTEIFSRYRQVEPSSIFDLNEEEKGYVEIYIQSGFQHENFEDVSQDFELDKIKVLFWD